MSNRPVGVQFPRNFSFRLSENDAARLCVVAAAAGYLPSEWARMVVSREAGIDFVRRPIRLRILHAELLRGYLVELTRQGNNLNQIAKVLNERKIPALDELPGAIAAIREQNQNVMNAVLDALGAGAKP